MLQKVFIEIDILFREVSPSDSNLVIKLFYPLYKTIYISQFLYNKKYQYLQGYYVIPGILCHLIHIYEIEKRVAIRNSSYDKSNGRWLEWKRLFFYNIKNYISFIFIKIVST